MVNLRKLPAGKLEDLLELCQPYPGDPANVLQFKGRRFVCFRFTEDEIVVYDQIFLTDAVLTVSMASQQGFEPGRWYSQIRCQETGTIVYTHRMTGMASPFRSMIGPGTPSEPSSSAPHTLGTLAPTSDRAVSS